MMDLRIVSGIVSLSLYDEEQCGRDDIKVKDVQVCLAKVTCNDGDEHYDTLGLNDDSFWCGFNIK